GDRAHAAPSQGKARKREPKNGAFAADLCRAFIEQKQAAKAVPECKAAVDLDPKNPLAHYELMKALVAKGDCGGAKSANASFKALPVKPEAKTQGDALPATSKK